MGIIKLIKTFSYHYGDADRISAYFAPGRVNLIGEHTDYNGGFVLPCALNSGTYLVCRKTDDQQIKFISTNIRVETQCIASLQLGEINKKQNINWINYPLGVINQFVERGLQISGMELLFSGNIPLNAGLSSSASIELVTASALNELFNAGLSRLELALLSQKAENDFVGVNCGIMDQFASAMGVKNSAIALDCVTLDYEIVPLMLEDYKLLISNTNKPRSLSESKYNERREECERAVKYISVQKPIKNLCELSLSSFLDLQNAITDLTIRKRARHVISENQRVIEAVAVLRKGDIEVFGRLMNESHESLRYDYEVTGVELDTLVEEARKIKGVLGSRMTGAGFGGCTISLVHKDVIDEFQREVSKHYSEKTNLTPDFYIAEIGDGARAMNSEQ